MLRILAFLLFCFSFAFCEAEPSIFDMINSEQSRNKLSDEATKNSYEQKIQDIRGILPTDEPDINLPDSQIYDLIKPKSVILKATNVPKSVIVGEIFSVQISANTQSDFDFSFTTDVNATDLKWLNEKNLEWVKSQNGNYVANFYFIATSPNAKNANISVELSKNAQSYQKASINLFLPQLQDLHFDSDFSHIVANLLEVKKFKTSRFDDVNYIMVVELYGKNVDLSSFNIDNKSMIKQGVDTITGDFGSQSGYYFAVFSPSKETLDFNYYNLINEKFQNFSLPVSVEDDEISTQLGLNPKQSDFVKYKQYLIYSLAIIFILIAIFRKSLSFFILGIIFIAVGIYTYNPFSKATLKADVSVRILPTQRSTIFYTTTQNEPIEIIGDRDDYIKVLFGDLKIGWVKKDDILKN